MKRILLSFIICTLPALCNASDTAGAKYSISSIYTGVIGKSNITMNLISSKGIISGSYIYDKYKKKILLNGVVSPHSIELKEETKSSSATITLTQTDKGYIGKWCDKKCVPVTMHTNNSFRDGELNGVEMDGSDTGTYKIILKFKSKNETIIVSDAIDIPSLEFVDVNGDGYYDLIVTTDHRPNNGSQTIYLSGDSGFSANDVLSKEDGTLVYEPYKKELFFNLKDDCCNSFSKIVYFFENGKVVKVDSISFDYSSNIGKNSKGENISKEQFESY